MHSRGRLCHTVYSNPKTALTHQMHFKSARCIDPKMCRVHPVSPRKRGMRWAGTAPVAVFGAYKKGLIESLQRPIFNGITRMAPGFGAQAALPGLPVHRHTVEVARGTLEGLESDLIIIALRRQFQGEADLQLWGVASRAIKSHRCLVARF